MAIDTKALLTDEQRTEAEAIIRSQGRTCRGPLRAPEAKAVQQLLAEGRREEASAMDHAGRVHPETGATLCGRDFNDTVVAGPWDGAEHEYTCPRCTLVGRYVAPKFAAPAAPIETTATTE